MKTVMSHQGIRPNPAGDWPEIDVTAFVDPSAQVIGKIKLGPKVYVGPETVIRADEVGEDGLVQPVIIETETHLQDGVIVHSRGGTSVLIGPRCTIAHGVIIHGPCTIGQECFLALRSVLYNATLEDGVWVGIGAIVMKSNVPSHTMIPAGSVIRTESDVRHFRLTHSKEEEYKGDVHAVARALREGYMGLYEFPSSKAPKE